MLKPDSYVQPNLRLTPSRLSLQEGGIHATDAALEHISENTLIAKNQTEHPPTALADRSQNELTDQTTDELLDEPSLKTVLDMLEVIDCVEELDLLETLTVAQKKQVWALTPEATRLRLKQIRAAALSSADARSLSSPLSTHALTASHEVAATVEANTSVTEVEYIEEIDDLDDALDEPDAHDSDVSDLANSIPDALWQKATESLAGKQINQATEPLLQIGDRVVLHANPKLTMGEMIAIWEVLEVQGRYARIKAKQIGTRNYPIAWMVLYPQPTLDSTGDAGDIDATNNPINDPTTDLATRTERGMNPDAMYILEDLEDDDIEF